MEGKWHHCGFVGRWQSWLCVCLLMFLVVSDCDGISIQVVESISAYEQGRVTIKCTDSTATLYRRVGDAVISEGVGMSTGYTFRLTYSNEGYYFCRNSMGENSTEMELVAYPFPDPSVPRIHSASLGSKLQMPCTIPYGALVHRYSVQWFEGLIPINTTARPHISVDYSNAALVFSSVQAHDNGNGYYCIVTVNSTYGEFTRQGATISLIVEAPLQFITGLARSTARVDDQATLTCSGSAVPAPTFRWLVGGEQRDIGVASSTELRTRTTITTTSTLTMSGISARNSGQVTCVALHQRGGVVEMASSTTNFIVLTNNFTISLIIQEGEVFVRSTLPVSIPGVFTLAIEFYHSSFNSEESSVFDPSLADTRDINIKIPRDKLPTGFREFSVRVALKVGDVRGPFTSMSNRISLPDGVQSCDCNGGSTSSNLSNTIVVAVVAVFIVLVVAAIVVLVVGCIFLYHKKVNLEKMYDLSRHNSRGSLPRCPSRTSCSSRGSRSSERSYKCSPPSASRSGHGSCRSINRNEVELGVIEETGEVQASPYENMKMKQDKTEVPRDVLEFETMDHRVLRQREELRANYRANLDQRAGVPTALRGPEPVFPNTHIGAVNPVPYRAGHKNRNQGRDSGSSFEDLEEEFLEFSHKSY